MSDVGTIFPSNAGFNAADHRRILSSSLKDVQRVLSRPTDVTTNGEVIIQERYKTAAGGFAGRLVSSGISGMISPVASILLNGTASIDMVACLPTIVRWACTRSSALLRLTLPTTSITVRALMGCSSTCPMRPL